MAVPDTNNFTLQDVTNEIYGDADANRNLVDCFDDANAAGFDSSYEGSKNSLLNFRNYNHNPASLSATPTTIYFDATTAFICPASTTTIIVTASTGNAWVATPNDSWIRVIGGSGTGSGSFTVSSLSTGTKSGSITISSDAPDITINVVQGTCP